MGQPDRIVQIDEWRARRASRDDIPMDAPPFVLEEPCPGCGARRVATMVWRPLSPSEPPLALPRMEPHFLCRDGAVVCQEITDAGIRLAGWSGILGHFDEEAAGA